MAMVQMNTRIESDVKRRGDAVFANLGLTPSDVVRAVWEYAANHSEAPAVLAQALDASHADASALEQSFRTAVAESAGNLVARFREAAGAAAPDELDVMDYAALREEAWSEKIAERGLA